MSNTGVHAEDVWRHESSACSVLCPAPGESVCVSPSSRASSNSVSRRPQVCAPLSQFLATVPASASRHSLTNWTTLVATLDSLDLIGFMITPTPSMFLIPSDAAVANLQAERFGEPIATRSHLRGCPHALLGRELCSFSFPCTSDGQQKGFRLGINLRN